MFSLRWSSGVAPGARRGRTSYYSRREFTRKKKTKSSISLTQPVCIQYKFGQFVEEISFHLKKRLKKNDHRFIILHLSSLIMNGHRNLLKNIYLA